MYFTLIKLNRFYSQIHELSSETENNIISIRFKQLLQSEVKNNRSIEYYAQKLGVSRITLNHCVKKQFGMTSSEMVDTFILFEIKSLLLYSTLNVNEIANLINFSEPNHLSRFFKRHTKLTPTEYKLYYQNGSYII